MTKVITVRLPDSLYIKLKNKNKSIKDIVIKSLQRYFYYDNLIVTGVNELNTSNQELDIDSKVDMLLNKRWRDF